jgi:hypothetical protein
MPIRGLPLAYVAVGGILVFSGLENATIGDTLRTLATGKKPANGPAETYATAASGDTAAATAPDTGVGGTVAKNQAIARVLAAPYGWSTGQEWDDLVSLWQQESSWSNTASNPSGAYGIPQALPASKMGTLANPPVSSATAQINWGLSYIKSTYGDPVAAWAHEEADGWY